MQLNVPCHVSQRLLRIFTSNFYRQSKIQFDNMRERSNPKNSVPLYTISFLYIRAYFMSHGFVFWYFLLFIQVLLLREEYIPSVWKEYIRKRNADENSRYSIYFLYLFDILLRFFYRNIFIFIIDYYIISPFLWHVQPFFLALRLIIFFLLHSFFVHTWMRSLVRRGRNTIEVTEVRNSKVEDGIFCLANEICRRT